MKICLTFSKSSFPSSLLFYNVFTSAITLFAIFPQIYQANQNMKMQQKSKKTSIFNHNLHGASSFEDTKTEIVKVCCPNCRYPFSTALQIQSKSMSEGIPGMNGGKQSESTLREKERGKERQKLAQTPIHRMYERSENEYESNSKKIGENLVSDVRKELNQYNDVRNKLKSEGIRYGSSIIQIQKIDSEISGNGFPIANVNAQSMLDPRIEESYVFKPFSEDAFMQLVHQLSEATLKLKALEKDLQMITNERYFDVSRISTQGMKNLFSPSTELSSVAKGLTIQTFDRRSLSN